MSTDREAEFVKLLEEHSGIIYKVTRIYARGTADEQDLRQEVVYQAWKSYARFKGDSKFSTWLYRVALNTALTHRKKETKNQEGFEKDWQVKPEGDDRALLLAHIRDLNDAEKLVIMLHLDGYGNEEIAMISGISKNHVAVRLHRIKEKLKNAIKKNDHEN